jgi:GNAT superfamily N-acetyltransferase
MPDTLRILTAAQAEAALPALVDILIDCVEGGASVSFMLPLSRDRAERFWRGVAADVAAGGRILLVAEDGSGRAIGTAQVVLAQPENQPHRGDVAKMLVHRSARNRGIAGRLLAAAEAAARAAGKTLLVLDTASAEAERVYERGGWTRVGVVPGYALWPQGGLCDTVFFYKRL